MLERRVLAVLSGKGGVGKTTVAVGLALALSESGFAVGLLDADLYGPDVPRMLGLTRVSEAKQVTVWTRPDSKRPRPVEHRGLKIWSSQFLVSESQPVSFQAPLAGLLLHRAFTAVDWGDLDWLVVDLPPGTADIQQQLVSLGVGAALIVVTPQDVAHLDAKKVLSMLTQAGVQVLGGVENMAGLVCPHCEQEISLFPETPHDRTIWASGVKPLARIPFSVGHGRIAEAGQSPLRPSEDDGVGDHFRALAQTIELAYPPKP